MPRTISLQVYVSPELAAQVRAAAAKDDLAVSEWLRAKVKQTVDAPADDDLLSKLYRQSLFAFVGVDALLSGHPDHTLRERAHAAWKTRCKDAQVASALAKAGSK